MRQKGIFDQWHGKPVSSLSRVATDNGQLSLKYGESDKMKATAALRLGKYICFAEKDGI